MSCVVPANNTFLDNIAMSICIIIQIGMPTHFHFGCMKTMNNTIIQAFNEIDEYAKDITDPDTFLKNYDKPYKRLFKTIIVNIQQGKSLLTLLNIILSAKNNGFEVATISEIPNNREVWFSTNSLSIRVDIAEQIFQ